MADRRTFSLVARIALLCFLVSQLAFCLEERRGTIQRTTDPVCNLGCGTFYLDPDPLYQFGYLRGSDFYPYLGMHVQVIGSRGVCAACGVFDVVSITVLPPVAVGPEEGIPRELLLRQNYPNPFNPSTTILYAIPNSQQVSLTIYNMLGEKIAEPVNRVEHVGTHAVSWDAGNSPGGVYYYCLTTASGRIIKRMVLVR